MDQPKSRLEGISNRTDCRQQILAITINFKAILMEIWAIEILKKMVRSKFNKKISKFKDPM